MCVQRAGKSWSPRPRQSLRATGHPSSSLRGLGSPHYRLHCAILGGGGGGRVIQGCSGEPGKWVLPPASGRCCLEQGWEETPTAVWTQVPPPPLRPSLRYRWRLGSGGQGASGITLETCRRQLAGLCSETHNFSVLRAHTCQENTSPMASSRSLLSVPQGRSWPSRFSLYTRDDPSSRATHPQGFQPQGHGRRANSSVCTARRSIPDLRPLGLCGSPSSPALKGAP